MLKKIVVKSLHTSLFSMVSREENFVLAILVLYDFFIHAMYVQLQYLILGKGSHG